jgi:hypothetical protein
MLKLGDSVIVGREIIGGCLIYAWASRVGVGRSKKCGLLDF